MKDFFLLSADFCQTATVLISLTAYLPQWTLLWRTKSSESVSLRAWAVWGLASACTLYYAIVQVAIHGTGWALVISTTCNFLCICFTFGLVFYYREGSPTYQE